MPKVIDWWQRLFPRSAVMLSEAPEYRVAFCLYSADGKRSVEVRERSDGRAYFIERAWVEGTTFRDLNTGDEIGPYETPEATELAAISRPWFSEGKI
ncbi:hypothetical protein ACVWYH_000492 [Bradyrhizobium sp. GM24.11]|jgi:hypothetical protein